MAEEKMTPKEIIAIVQRRKTGLIIPTFAVVLISVVIAFTLPSYYKSESTILIEEQEIPADFVMATVTSFVEQRLQSINQRIMSSTRLLELINRFSLYDDLKGKWASEEIVEKMREDIKMETIMTDVIDRRTGRATSATIAFTLSYEGKDPKKVQQVANTLTSFFLEENLKVRERQTQEASAFLEEEMEKVKDHLEGLQRKISLFKEQHINELPELLQVNQQSMNNIEQNIDRLTEQLRGLKEREGYLKTQLSALSPDFDSDIDKRRLEELKLEMITLKSRFSEKHPDVIKLGNQIDEVKKQISLKREEERNKTEEILNPENPSYVTLAAQLASTSSEIDSIKRQIEDAQKKREIYQSRIGATPKIEAEYNAMLVEKQNTNLKYNDLMQKMMEARVAQGLEKEKKGERFTLIDPPRLPEKPFKPKRWAIILMGVILGIGAGVATTSILEFTDDRIRNSNALSMAVTFPVLVGIPYIETKKDSTIKSRRRIVAGLVVLVVIVLGIGIFHYFIMDLNVFWAKLSRKMGL